MGFLMKLDEYIKEAVDRDKTHHKLLVRFVKARAKLGKARDTIMNVKDEMEKIQKQMRRHGIDELINPQGNAVLDAEEEYSVWDAMA